MFLLLLLLKRRANFYHLSLTTHPQQEEEQDLNLATQVLRYKQAEQRRAKREETLRRLSSVNDTQDELAPLLSPVLAHASRSVGGGMSAMAADDWDHDRERETNAFNGNGYGGGPGNALHGSASHARIQQMRSKTAAQ